MTSLPRGAAPLTIVLTWDKCWDVQRSLLFKHTIIGGTNVTKVALCTAKVDIYVSGSKRGSVTSLQPSDNFDRSTKVKP